ncbi:hypothetical protein CPB86DRAFT_726602, partial [Serendipita vermifera]
MEGSEVALTSALLATLGAVVYYAWSGSTSQPSNVESKPSTRKGAASSKGGSKKGKKRGISDLSAHASTTTNNANTNTLPTEAIPSTTPRMTAHKNETTIPGGLMPLISASEMESAHSAGSSTGSKRKKKAKKSQTIHKTRLDDSSSGLMLAPPLPSTSKPKLSISHQYEGSGASEFDSEASWAKVGQEKSETPRTESASDAGITTSVTEEEEYISPKGENTLTSAEKLLPKPVKTAVDDMLEGPRPGIARVLRVPGRTSGPNYDQPARGLTWEDYEDGEDVKGSGADADEEDSTWDVVVNKKSDGTRTPSTYASDSAPSGKATTTSAGPLTKKQRQNAARRESDKLAKAAAEEERRARLERHNKQLERARIDEQYRGNGPSGGMRATVTPSGSLAWE